ncbi:DUF6665 family protein [Rhizobium sp. LC145]|uniref:DUF6665 family protein n=1 Tax=Rhizobium sp. LC145 TaxID=1120688 RepID=UPI00062A1A60|nr:DUF6665 family protein [Rhizobium sp. LC145]KKX32994.1 hypothetical protein YH62_05460 [Rhizobium sp. LC145]TKT55931.1 hypothetical protein FDR95_16865 [Rhizobiaceae bacterium LC148]
MSFRLPRSLSQQSGSSFNALGYELASVRADALGRHGRKVEVELANLRNWSKDAPSHKDRETLVENASEAVWAFFIQREICGLRNTREVADRYGIPNEVLARLGAIRK